MATLSKLSDKCKKCSNVNNCNNKRMVACAMSEIKPNLANATNSTTMPLTLPMFRIEHQITINMGEYGAIDTSIEEIAEQLNKNFNINCAFNKL